MRIDPAIGARIRRANRAQLTRGVIDLESLARASTTDAEARVMKMGNGGFRPAYSVQIATTADKARVIVGFSVTNRGQRRSSQS